MSNQIIHNIQAIELFWKYSLCNVYKNILIEIIQDKSYFEITDNENYFITFYNSSDLIERNQTYAIQEIEPDYLMVGQDGDIGYYISNITNDYKLYCLELGALGVLPIEVFINHLEDLF